VAFCRRRVSLREIAQHVNREDVRHRVDRLREDYGDVVVLESEGTLPPERFERMHEDARDGYTGGGYAWVRMDPADAPTGREVMPDEGKPDRPHALLMLERGVEGTAWELPGGGREDDETYEAAAEREVAEETGVECAVSEPYLLYYDRLRSEDSDAVLHTLWACFDATYEGGSIAVQREELRGAAWFDAPPAALRPWAQYRAVDWWDDYTPDERWWADLEPR
jgi:8-oxo-dGTP pyrophosphatase MutT (NUDIX family)